MFRPVGRFIRFGEVFCGIYSLAPGVFMLRGLLMCTVRRSLFADNSIPAAMPTSTPAAIAVMDLSLLITAVFIDLTLCMVNVFAAMKV